MKYLETEKNYQHFKFLYKILLKKVLKKYFKKTVVKN